MTPLIQLTKVSKEYQTGEIATTVLKEVSLEIKKGEFVAVVGPSGSGKSTLMNIIGLLDKPSNGSYKLDGKEASRMDEDSLAIYRNKKIGFVFQSFNLLARTSAEDNVSLPLVYSGVDRKQRLEAARGVLTRVGLWDKFNSRPNQLSGGQQQRVAIARALVTNPDVILADEPTGNLDTKSGKEVLNIFKELHKEGKTVVLITHDLDVAKNAKRVITVRDGEVKRGR